MFKLRRTYTFHFIIVISTIFIISVISCKEDEIKDPKTDLEDTVDIQASTLEQTVKNLSAIREGDSIKLTWTVPDYEYQMGYKIINEKSSFEGTIIENEVNEYYIPTYPGLNNINVYLQDVEKNLSKPSHTSIQITDVYVLRGGGFFWKNGQLRNNGSGFTEICANGNDVFTVANYTRSNDGKWIATYWKNSEPVHLTDGIKDFRARSIHVYNNKVFVAGYEEDRSSGLRTIYYWVDGVPTKLTNSINRANIYSNSIRTDGENVWVTGVEEVPEKGYMVAKYWLNNVEYILSHDGYEAEETCIFVENGKVYIAANLRDLDNNFRKIALWMDGIEQTLDIDTTVNAFTYTHGISVKNGKICIPVYESDVATDESRIRYLIDGKDMGVLSSGLDAHWKVTSCVSNAGDFYIAWAEKENGTSDYNVYSWKNGDKIKLTDQSGTFRAQSIFIAD